MRPTLMGLLAKNAEICPCVRPARKGKPLGFILLRADESSLHVRPSTPESYTLYYPAQSGLRHKYTILKLNDK